MTARTPLKLDALVSCSAGAFKGPAVLWLGALLRTWIVALGGFAFGSDAKFVRRFDGEGRFRFPGHRCRGGIAILADERRDRITKLSEYAGFGVRLYWMLDP